MIATTIRTSPSVEDYVPLAEYESQTPESFADGKAVLHLHVAGATIQAPKAQSGNLAIFPADAAPAEDAQANGESAAEPLMEQKVDVYVTSENFVLFNQQASAGVSIPYPSISIHALKHVGPESEEKRAQAVWMQVEVSDGGAGDDDFNMTELTIIPSPTGEDESAESSAAKGLFEAMSKCSDLHPDPEDEDDEDDADRIVFDTHVEPEALEGFSGVLRGTADGTLPPPMPGSGGWITAENMHEFFDEDGNYIGRDGEGDDTAPVEGELGEGAGRIRGRDEVEGEDGGDGLNGHAEDDQENKRPRVD
ncbi:benzoylformate decarboxylase [Purpureocillium lavendulum]|uniref:Benzoylformate decarboxylase n=1 Tax=Purpureocillium lavendulum TaxID=1247861 RepID=A0AB34FGQ2_9HYPO|nr:benzoylformate decarboxylase [Purpureocillium lavendulum]